MPIIISTQTIAKQELVVKRTIPTLSEWLLNAGLIDKPIRSAIRKGKSHYICEDNLPKNKSDEYIRKLKRLRTGTPDLDVSKDITNFDKSVICVKQSCEKSCRSYHACRYRAYLRDESNGNVDFIVCNHNYYLADQEIRRKYSRMLLPMYKSVVVDLNG
jgi:ATP-dependent DNA helicase DinG